MDKHRCKLCLRSFFNGRALGGHMRSHMLNLYVPPKIEQPTGSSVQLSDPGNTESSSSDGEENEDDDDKMIYELRENPKRSVRLVDPDFSSSVILQDRESETESWKKPNRVRRSKRIRKDQEHQQQQQQQHPEVAKKFKLAEISRNESPWAEPEPVSSISDNTPDEDVAYCLMMLSRDKWKIEGYKRIKKYEEEEEDEEIDDEEEDEQRFFEESDHEQEEQQRKISKNRARGKYRCETCDRVFKSYQALGGHRASHKKIKVVNFPAQEPAIVDETENALPEEKIHECPVCYRVFASGQALGGHKRSHVTGSSATIVYTNAHTPPTTATIVHTNTHTTLTTPTTAPAANTTWARHFTKQREGLIDLNLPAPMDDDDYNQIEVSAVSDSEFVRHH